LDRLPRHKSLPLIIAHRGASGYLPEHTLAAKALAYGMGADYLEQDVVASKDGELIVCHDIHIDRVTDVADRFPDRARDDGRWYVRDFDLAELRTLRVHERLNDAGDAPAFPNRFPADRGDFRVVTLREEIEMVQGLNRSTGRQVGIYPEIKEPAWHRAEGFDLSRAVLQTLADYGYRSKDDLVFVQCFDPAEVQRLRFELGCPLRLIQLIDAIAPKVVPEQYEAMLTEAGMAQLASFVDGLGPWFGLLYELADIDGHPVSTGFVKLAHEAGLAVHPYTFRADQVAPGFETDGDMLRWFAETLKIDGVFTDFPDRSRVALG